MSIPLRSVFFPRYPTHGRLIEFFKIVADYHFESLSALKVSLFHTHLFIQPVPDLLALYEPSIIKDTVVECGLRVFGLLDSDAVRDLAPGEEVAGLAG
jgi:hypothetical protein